MAKQFSRLEDYANVTWETLRLLLKGTPSEKYGKNSITQKGMNELHRELLMIAQTERGFQGTSLTSNDAAALFQGESWVNGEWSKEGREDFKFHPMAKFGHLYSEEMPDRIQSYPWKGFSLETHLNAYINQLLELCPPHTSEHGDPKFWVDVYFSDQNSEDISKYLRIADCLYFLVRTHYANILSRMTSRAWVLQEIIIRLIRVIVLHNLLARFDGDLTAAIIEVGEMCKSGDPDCTVFVIVPGSTDLFEDALNGGHYNWLEASEAFKEEDKRQIQARGETVLGCKEAFDFAVCVLANAAIYRHGVLHPVSCFPPCDGVRDLKADT